MKLEANPYCPPRKPAHRRLLPQTINSGSVAESEARSSQVVVNDVSRAYQTDRRCGLSQCRKLNCNLGSHRRYVAMIRETGLSEGTSRNHTFANRLSLEGDQALVDRSVSRIEKQLAESFPPVKFNTDTRSTFRALAHHYFNVQVDRLIQLFSPQLDRQKYKRTMAEHATSNDVFCVCIMAHAKIDMLMCSHVRRPDRSSEMVYATTAHVLRRQLDDFKKTDADWLLVLVVALVGFDLAFDRRASLHSHHKALRQLISIKGGIHKVGHTLPYVTGTDRNLAIFTGQYPVVQTTPLIPVSAKVAPSLGAYGNAFQDPHLSRQLDEEVAQFCLDLCEMMHLMDSFHVSFKPNSPVASDLSVLPYFLYVRDRIACEGTCLYAFYHENQNKTSTLDLDAVDGSCESPCKNDRPFSKSRCILLAAMIVEYVVAHAHHYTVKGPFLGSQLKSILEHPRAPCWSENEETLLWLLFVLATAIEHWESHDWAVKMLRHHLIIKFKRRLPRLGWQDEQLDSLKRFVWHETHLAIPFAKVCYEVNSLGNK